MGVDGDKNVDELAALFNENARFVHMSGSWGTDRELEIIESGSIWYKNTDVHQVVVETFGDTVILWNRITLEAEVRGNVVPMSLRLLKSIKTKREIGACWT